VTEQRPSVGRVVHYVAYGTPGGEFPAGVCRAAMITAVGPLEYPGEDPSADNVAHPTASLCVLNPTGLFFNPHVPYDGDAKRPGSWHWPERQ
jgi:hypothetical protein